MELRHLRYFVAIAEERSITRRRRTAVGRPARAVDSDAAPRGRARRRAAGAPSARGHLTHAGDLFLERARVALAAADVAAATGRDLQAGLIGSLRLGVASGPGWPLTADFLQRFGRERPGVELSVVQGYGAMLWRDLRDGRLDAVLTATGNATAAMKVLDLGSAEWVVLIGIGHPLAGIGPVTAGELEGERIAVTGHRDGAAYDKAVVDVLTELGVTVELVAGVPWPALPAAIAGNEVVAVTTTPEALPAGVMARRLEPQRTLSFELLWRDETPSAALAGFVDAAAAHVQRRSPARVLAAVA